VFYAFIVGIILGIVFFGGLQWTIDRLMKVRYPTALVLVSMVIRMAILLLGFYLLKDGSYYNIPLALLGVVLVRVVMVSVAKKETVKANRNDDGEG